MIAPRPLADFAVERKSVPDLRGRVTRERERFECELHRLRGFAFKRLVIVGTPAEVELLSTATTSSAKKTLTLASEFNRGEEQQTKIKLTPAAAQAVRCLFSIDQGNKPGDISALPMTPSQEPPDEPYPSSDLTSLINAVGKSAIEMTMMKLRAKQTPSPATAVDGQATMGAAQD